MEAKARAKSRFAVVDSNKYRENLLVITIYVRRISSKLKRLLLSNTSQSTSLKN